jgi:hypothetical protein
MSFKSIGAALVFLAGTAWGATACDLLWQVSSPLPTGRLVNQLACGNSTFVGVGPSGNLETSADGLVWERQCSPTAQDFMGVVYGNSRFLAASGNRPYFTVHVSGDGLIWQSKRLDQMSPSPQFQRLLFAGDHFFGIDGSAIYFSKDGLNWGGVGVGASVLQDLCFGQGLYLAVDLEGNFFTSSDAQTWSRHAFPNPGQYRRVVYGGGVFVAVSYSPSANLQISTSHDGSSWTLAPCSPNVSPTCTALYAGDRFVLLDMGSGMWSTDGTEWTNFSYDVGLLRQVIWTGTAFMGFDTGADLWKSSDGVAWETLNTSEPIRGTPWKIVATGSPRSFAMVGQGGLIGTSQDGRSWSLASVASNEYFFDVVSGGGRLVAAGSNGALLVSDDGTSWRDVSLHIPKSLRAISYGAGVFVAVGETGIVYTSPDGLSWTGRDTGSRQTFKGLAFGNGLFLAVGVGGALYRGSDGIHWVGQEAPNQGRDYDTVCFGNGVFLVGDNLGDIFVGSDGVHWQQIQVSGAVSSLVFAGGTFFRQGGSWPATSADGLHWTESPQGLGYVAAGPATDGEVYVAATVNQNLSPVMLWSGACFPSVASVDPDTLPPDGGATVTLTGEHLSAATGVKVGGVPCPSFEVVSDTEIKAVTPPRPEGFVGICVTTPGGTSQGTEATMVVVGTRPSISSVGKLSSPYRLKIRGSGFKSDDVILVNGVPVPKTTYKSDGQLLAQGGALLKVMLPKGRPAEIKVVNAATGIPSHAYPFTP